MQINKVLLQNYPNQNFTPGRNGNSVSKIIIHTMVGNMTGSQARFANPAQQVTVHYGIGLNGEIRQWVDESNTAWQAGNYPVNLTSIGIEHEDNGNYNDPVRTDAEYNSSSDLVADICRRYGIPCDRGHILKHSEVIDKSVYPGGTACCDGLDINRIVREAEAKLNGAVAPAPAPAPAPTPQATAGQFINLPGTVDSWRVYNVGGPWTVGHEVAVLDPALYDGLSYQILGNPAANVYVIQTQMFGRVAIYGGPDTPASFSDVAAGTVPSPAPAQPAPEPTPAPAPAPVVEAPAPLSPVAPDLPATSTVPVTLQDDFRTTFKPGNGTYKALRDIVVKDLFVNTNPDQRLGHDQIIQRAGTFIKDGVTYVRTKKSVANNVWYGIPLKDLVPTASANKVVNRLVQDIKATPVKLLDDIDNIAEEISKDPSYHKFVSTQDSRSRLVARIGRFEDLVATFLSKLNIFKRKK